MIDPPAHIFIGSMSFFPMNLQLPDSPVIWERAVIGAQGSRAANLCARKSEALEQDLCCSSAVPLLTAAMEMRSTQFEAITLRGSIFIFSRFPFILPFLALVYIRACAHVIVFFLSITGVPCGYQYPQILVAFIWMA